MGTTISILNEKGGVGKTTITSNISFNLSKNNSVLIIDNDPQGNLSNRYNSNKENISKTNNLYKQSEKLLKPIQVRKNLFLYTADQSLSEINEGNSKNITELKDKIVKLQKIFDYIIIDNAPSFSYLSISALIASDYLIIPTELSGDSFQGINNIINNVTRISKKGLNKDLKLLGIIVNMVEGNKTILERDLLMSLKKSYKDNLFQTLLTRSIIVKESGLMKQSLEEYNSKSKQALQYRILTDEIKKRINNLNN